MDIKQTRKALGLTLQAAGDRVGITREAVRLAEGGKLPSAAKTLSAFYQSAIARKVRKQMKNETISFKFYKRSDGTVVLRSESEKPFEITIKLIDALLDGFAKGASTSSDIEF
jgi:hypothetical protein